MEILKKNIKLLPFGLLFLYFLFVKNNPIFGEAIKTYIIVGVLIASVLFAVWYLSKKENRNSYKNNTLKGKLTLLVIAVIASIGLFIDQMYF